MRGVYYTPLPIVSYIVRSIDHILKTSFEKPQGLADPSVLVLDPAVGTATFLYKVMQEIHEDVIEHGQTGTWDNYVTEKLLPRLFGFEILMAPYAIAHLKLGRLLKETGYRFQTEQRLGIYLTNTLEEAVKHADTLFAQWITEEANAAADIKKTKPIMVVLGNPPYSGTSANKGKWAKELVQRYYQVDGASLGEKNPKWLQDDYVKFISFGQWRIEKTNSGVLGFITNHSYLDNPTFRGMRQSLMNTFTDIYILNMHGNSKKKEVAPDGSKDENVFDIQQGVSIGIFIKEIDNKSAATIHYADLWGKREEKYIVLAETYINLTKWTELKPSSPHYLFVPQDTDQLPEYQKGWKVTDIFPINGVGMTTARDHVVIDYKPEPLLERAYLFRDSEDSNTVLCDELQIPEKLGWNITKARDLLKQSTDLEQYIKPVMYRPFDNRLIFYHDSLVWRTVKQIMRHMFSGNNLSLCIGRAGNVVGLDTWNILFCSKLIQDFNLFYRGGNVNFPLYVYPVEGEMHFGEGRRPNLNPEFVKSLSEKLGLKLVEGGKGDLQQTLGPEDIFNYAYAVFHSPKYRSRYAEFLKIDFPRLPLTSDKELFSSLAERGVTLVSLHLMESPLLNNFITKYDVKGEHAVDKVSYNEKTQRVSINKAQYFEGVPPEVWNFHIGGYQVCEKWLKDRKGRKLSIDDIDHYQKIVVALNETIRLMTEIDGLITKWPIE
jgi:predicted helicase